MAQITAERDSARNLAIRLEEQLARIDELHQAYPCAAEFGIAPLCEAGCFRSGTLCATRSVLDEAVEI